MRLVLLWVLLLGHSVARAEEETVRMGLDCGYWHSALSGDAFVLSRVLFVRGAYEGATAFHMDVFDATAPTKAAAANTRQMAELFEKRFQRQTSYLALVLALDTFCSDALNEKIWLSGALKVVSMQLRAEPAEAIEVEIQRLRADPGP